LCGWLIFDSTGLTQEVGVAFDPTQLYRERVRMKLEELGYEVKEGF
jgi:hypothetical protein